MRVAGLALLLLTAPLGAAPSVLAQPEIGALAPPLRARELDTSREVALDAFRGQVVVLAFFATWCASCRRVAPTLKRWFDAHRDEGLSIVALSHEPRARLRRHVTRAVPGYPTLQCTGRTAVLYGADALPTLVLIDVQGHVRARVQGASPDGLGEFRAQLRNALEEAATQRAASASANLE